MTNQFILLIAVLAVFFILLQWIIYRQSKRSEGKLAPDTSELDELSHHPLRVYYFYSSTCGPCRQMTPLVDQLRKQHENLVKANITEHSQLARDFGIAGVPCFIVVTDGLIIKVKLGRVSESWLTEHLTESV